MSTKHVKADCIVHNEYDRLRSLKSADVKGIMHANEQGMHNSTVAPALIEEKSIHFSFQEPTTCSCQMKLDTCEGI